MGDNVFFVYAKQKLLRCIMAELLGTFFFLLFGCLAVVSEANKGAPTGYLASSLVWGLLIAALYVMIGPTSGCQLNPCITIAFAILKRVPPFEAFLIVIAQTAGALSGAGILYLLCTPDWYKAGNLGLLLPASDLEWYQAFIMEMILSAFYTMQVFNSFQPGKLPNRFEIGTSVEIAMVYTALTIAAASYSGCALNPLRALGPAVLLLNFEYHYIYWAGPVAGTIVGMAIHALFLKQALLPDDDRKIIPKFSFKPEKVEEKDEKDDEKERTADKTEEEKEEEMKRRQQQQRETQPVIIVGTPNDDSVLNGSSRDDEYTSRVVNLDDAGGSSVVTADIDALSKGGNE